MLYIYILHYILYIIYYILYYIYNIMPKTAILIGNTVMNNWNSGVFFPSLRFLRQNLGSTVVTTRKTAVFFSPLILWSSNGNKWDMMGYNVKPIKTI